MDTADDVGSADLAPSQESESLSDTHSVGSWSSSENPGDGTASEHSDAGGSVEEYLSEPTSTQPAENVPAAAPADADSLVTVYDGIGLDIDIVSQELLLSSPVLESSKEMLREVDAEESDDDDAELLVKRKRHAPSAAGPSQRKEKKGKK
jgi:hypothetical protein